MNIRPPNYRSGGASDAAMLQLGYLVLFSISYEHNFQKSLCFQLRSFAGFLLFFSVQQLLFIALGIRCIQLQKCEHKSQSAHHA